MEMQNDELAALRVQLARQEEVIDLLNGQLAVATTALADYQRLVYLLTQRNCHLEQEAKRREQEARKHMFFRKD